jgi:hypothetical protein
MDHFVNVLTGHDSTEHVQEHALRVVAHRVVTPQKRHEIEAVRHVCVTKSYIRNVHGACFIRRLVEKTLHGNQLLRLFALVKQVVQNLEFDSKVEFTNYDLVE